MKSRKNNLFKKLFMLRKPFYKTWWIDVLILVLTLFLVIGVPIIINELYKQGTGYVTVWGAEDVLSFYAVILSGIITISALIVTIRHGKKDTEKQIKYYMSQTKPPFFIVDEIIQQVDEDHYICYTNNSDRTFSYEYRYTDNGQLEPSMRWDIIIYLKNVGEGIALSPSYITNMFASDLTQQVVINKGDRLKLSYNLQTNLNDKYIQIFLKNNSSAEGEIIFNTYINVKYKNVVGIEFLQTIAIDIKTNLKENMVNVTFHEISPQEIPEIL